MLSTPSCSLTNDDRCERCEARINSARNHDVFAMCRVLQVMQTIIKTTPAKHGALYSCPHVAYGWLHPQITKMRRIREVSSSR